MARNPLYPYLSGGLDRGYGDPFREMTRLFDDILRGGGAARGEQEQSVLMPHMDVSESDREVRICIELPGVREEDVEVTLHDDVLTIRGEKRFERKEEKENFHFLERSYGTFQRALRIPYRLDPDQVQAAFEHGVLTVTLPKGGERERSRRIAVRGGSEGAKKVEARSGGAEGGSAPRAGGGERAPQGKDKPEEGAKPGRGGGRGKKAG